jgi:Flp pilus assembly pilin Flp
MTQLRTSITHLIESDRGQDLLEYGLLMALIVVVAIAGISAVGNTIFTVFWSGIGQAI